MLHFETTPAVQGVSGRVSSFETMGTLDGPGVRFIAFLQGCPLRCACCHNPETFNPAGGTSYTAAQIAEMAMRYREYYGQDGGITLSGGEPLLQPDFAREIFRLSHQAGIRTCLDTSGGVPLTRCGHVLDETDYCLLDIKYANDADYRQYVGISAEMPLRFLEELNRRRIPTVLRRVIIRGLNDSVADTRQLALLFDKYSCVQQIELLPFRRLCRGKYEKLGLTFRLADVSDTTEDEIRRLSDLLPPPRDAATSL